MALSNEQKKDLESKINKGLTPICPICKSKLIVSPVQEGDDGSKGREYECSRDKLKEGKTCDLEPGFAYIQGWKRIPLALNKNIINGILTSIGSITLAGLVSFSTGAIEWGNSEESTPPDIDTTQNKPQPETTITNTNTEKFTRNIDSLKTEIANKDALYKDLIEYRLALGLFLSGYNNEDLKNSDDSRKFLIESLENRDARSDKEKILVLERLRYLNIGSKKFDDWKNLKELIDTYKPNSWPNENQNMAILYYNLGMTAPAESSPSARQYRQESLKYYFQFKNSLIESQTKEVFGMLKLIYSQDVSESDADFLERTFKNYSNPTKIWLAS